MTMTSRTVAKLGLIAAIVASISGSAFAQHYSVQPRAQDFSAAYGGVGTSDAFAAYNRDLQGIPCGVQCDVSGTAGRLGLGASPAHPEGPGNFSD
ncbi:hypothetical protein [Methyloferula stellata]|uniref:hypothetical protein n=1 Tax=Methyloferula stellata TaxID=876270 RepID=UPI000370B813|nr:hypothetical protein [Methyloferula stellata]